MQFKCWQRARFQTVIHYQVQNAHFMPILRSHFLVWRSGAYFGLTVPLRLILLIKEGKSDLISIGR